MNGTFCWELSHLDGQGWSHRQLQHVKRIRGHDTPARRLGGALTALCTARRLLIGGQWKTRAAVDPGFQGSRIPGFQDPRIPARAHGAVVSLSSKPGSRVGHPRDDFVPFVVRGSGPLAG